jgi:hypothetical protein
LAAHGHEDLVGEDDELCLLRSFFDLVWCVRDVERTRRAQQDATSASRVGAGAIMPNLRAICLGFSFTNEVFCGRFGRDRSHRRVVRVRLSFAAFATSDERSHHEPNVQIAPRCSSKTHTAGSFRRPESSFVYATSTP